MWLLTQTPSIDGLTASGDNLSIEHNDGQIYRVKPRTNPEVNRWWTSDEIRYGWKFVHSPDRLRVPVRSQYGVQIETDWPRAYQEVNNQFKQIVRDRGPGSVAVMVSPMLACEEAYLLGRWVRGLDPQAVLAVGPVPVHGQDKTFPGGYTVRAEKCPNRRGVRRAMEQLTQDDAVIVAAYDSFVTMLADKNSSVAAVLLTGNYPSRWITQELVAALKGKFVAMIDTLPNDLTGRVDVLLPGATWVEKAGTFENAAGRLQSFQQAIPVIDLAKSEGQIALDLAAAGATGEPAVYDARQTRSQMGGVFATGVSHPVRAPQKTSDMVYAEL